MIIDSSIVYPWLVFEVSIPNFGKIVNSSVRFTGGVGRNYGLGSTGGGGIMPPGPPTGRRH